MNSRHHFRRIAAHQPASCRRELRSAVNLCLCGVALALALVSSSALGASKADKDPQENGFAARLEKLRRSPTVWGMSNTSLDR